MAIKDIKRRHRAKKHHRELLIRSLNFRKRVLKGKAKRDGQFRPVLGGLLLASVPSGNVRGGQSFVMSNGVVASVPHVACSNGHQPLVTALYIIYLLER